MRERTYRRGEVATVRGDGRATRRIEDFDVRYEGFVLDISRQPEPKKRM